MTSSFTAPFQLKKRYPLTSLNELFISKSRETVRNILNGKDPRILLIVGPCSIHDTHGALEYAKKLKALSEKTASSFFIIMRAYLEKPRTALGWKGLIHDPMLDGSFQMERGFEMGRELLLHLANLELPAALEFLDPPLAAYYGDLITWGCVGARTSSSQVHRQMASDLPMPIAFKNSTDGNIESAVNGCLAASYPHSFLGLNEEGSLSIQNSRGNPDTHIVLRGGANKPNYDSQSIQSALQALFRAGLDEKVIVDCAHDNSAKKHDLQKIVFEKVLDQMISAKTPICGLMLESYLNEGSQALSGSIETLRFGVSITDPCLSFEETEALILEADAKMRVLFAQRDSLNTPC